MAASHHSFGRLARLALCIVALCSLPATAQTTIPEGYYSRDQDNSELARASGHSLYIRFYPDQRVARLYIPWPYAAELDQDTIRQVFDRAVGTTSGIAYLADTFGLLDEKATVHLDRVRVIDGGLFFDCNAALPCRFEFTDAGLDVIRRGLATDRTTTYALVPD